MVNFEVFPFSNWPKKLIVHELGKVKVAQSIHFQPRKKVGWGNRFAYDDRYSMTATEAAGLSHAFKSRGKKLLHII